MQLYLKVPDIYALLNANEVDDYDSLHSAYVSNPCIIS